MPFLLTVAPRDPERARAPADDKRDPDPARPLRSQDRGEAKEDSRPGEADGAAGDDDEVVAIDDLARTEAPIPPRPDCTERDQARSEDEHEDAHRKQHIAKRSQPGVARTASSRLASERGGGSARAASTSSGFAAR